MRSRRGVARVGDTTRSGLSGSGRPEAENERGGGQIMLVIVCLKVCVGVDDNNNN